MSQVKRELIARMQKRGEIFPSPVRTGIISCISVLAVLTLGGVIDEDNLTQAWGVVAMVGVAVVMYFRLTYPIQNLSQKSGEQNQGVLGLFDPEQIRNAGVSTDELLEEFDDTLLATVNWSLDYRKVNRSFCDLTGYEAHEIEGHSYREFVSNETVSLIEDRRRRTAAGERLLSNSFPAEFRSKTGELIGLTVTACAARDEVGTANGYLCQHSPQERISDHEARLFRIAGEGVADYQFALEIHPDESVIITWLSPGFKDLTGYNVREVVGKNEPWEIYIHPDDAVKLHKIKKKAFTEEREADTDDRRISYRFRIRTRSEKLIWVVAHAVSKMEPDGIIRVHGGTRRMASVLDMYTVAVNADGIITHVADKLADLLDLSQDELVGQSVFSFANQDEQNAAREEFRKVLEQQSNEYPLYSGVLQLPNGLQAMLEARIQNLLNVSPANCVIFNTTLLDFPSEDRNLEKNSSIRSIIGTIQIAESDPDLSSADDAIRSLFSTALSAPLAQGGR